MKQKTFIKKSVTSLVLFTLLILGTTAGASEINDADALSGLTNGKGVYLISLDKPQKAALYLAIIKDTHQSMAAQGVKPDFIVVFVGSTVRFLTTEPAAELREAKPALESIAASIKELKKLGVRQEVCVIATDFFKISKDDLLPQLSLVGNGFSSLIGYQAKGYGLVPIF